MIIRPYQNAQFLKARLSRYVLSQDSAIEKIALAISQHYLACEYNQSCPEDDQIQTGQENILCYGPTGVGKSLCIKELIRLARDFDLPIISEAASAMSPNNSWRGTSIFTIVSKLFQAAGDLFYSNHPDNTDVEFAKAVITEMTEKNGIIILDEADKIFKKTDEDCERSSSHDYQSSLLKLVEGTTVPTDTFTHEIKTPITDPKTGEVHWEIEEVQTIDSVDIDTTHILWIFLGAFEGIDDIVKHRIQRENSKKTTVPHDYYQQCRAGFIQDKPASIKKEKPVDIDLTPNVDDLVEYGVKRELAGRLAIKVRFNPLNANALTKILMESPTSVYREYQRRFKLLGHTLVADSSSIRHLCQRAIANKTGARSLRQTFNELLSPVMFQLSAEPTPHICKLTGKLLKSGKPPIIEKKSQKRQQNKQNTQSDAEIMEIINNSTIRKAETA